MKAVTNLTKILGMMDAFVISRLAFLMAVALASFAGSAILGRLFIKQPERLRVALWWLLAVILALSCAWANASWPFPPRESQHWIGYVLLFAALLRSIDFPIAQLISALASAALAIVVTLLPIAQNGWGALMFGGWFFVSLLSYLIVRLVLHKEFETASLRASLLLAVPLFVSAVMLFFAGSAMLAELAVVGGIAVAATYLSQRSSALGHGFVEITLLFHFLLLLNCTIYADLPPVLAWLQWIVPALVILLAQLLHLQKRMTRRGHYITSGLKDPVSVKSFAFQAFALLRVGKHPDTFAEVNSRNRGKTIRIRLAVYALAVLRVTKHARTDRRIAKNGSAVNGLPKYADAVSGAGAVSQHTAATISSVVTHNSRYSRAGGITLIRCRHDFISVRAPG